jgi:hypothetical protein
MGASAFTGTITLTPTGSTGLPLVISVSLNLASPQPPYFTGTYSFGLPLGSPQSVTMPDGSVVTDGSSQVLAYLSANATTSQMQAVASAIAGSGGSVVGEIPSLHELQIQLSDVTKAGQLILTLESLAGVVFAGPNMALVNSQTSNTCSDTTIPAGGVCPTDWAQADNPPPLVPSPTSNVVLGVVDCFDRALCQVDSTGLSHGEIAAAFAQEAAGSGVSVQPVPFEPDAVCASGQYQGLKQCFSYHNMFTVAANFVKNNPGKTVVLNMSQGAPPTNPSQLGEPSDSTNETQVTLHYAALAAALQQQFGPNVLVVKASGNSGAPIGLSSSPCNFLDVGGLDQTSTSSLSVMANFSVFGPPVSVYAPACNVCPNNLQTPSGGIPEVSGTSFAAPQASGLAAAIMAATPGATACQVQAAISSPPGVPESNGAQLPVLNGVSAAKSVTGGQAPASTATPSNPLQPAACPYLTVSPEGLTLNTSTNKSGTLTPMLSSGVTGGLFNFSSNNSLVATVDSFGNVTAVNPGIATITVIAPGVPCEATATVIVNPPETYSGTWNETLSMSEPNTIPDGTCTPNPLVITGGESGVAAHLDVTPSLLIPGTFVGVLTLGSGTVTITVPTSTCTTTNPDGSTTTVTVPGSTETTQEAGTSGTLVGMSDGINIIIPVPGFAPMTGTISLSPSTVVTLGWNYTTTLPDMTVQVQISGSLTKQ